MFVGDSVSVQRVPFGVAALCICLGGLAHALCILVKKLPWLLPSDIGSTFIKKAHKPIVALAILGPLAISWNSNETLYGALNPVGYWRDQASLTTEGGCKFMRSILAHSAEKYQVAANKHDMGIATSTEVIEAAESLKVLSGIQSQCIQTEQARALKTTARLKELEQSGR